MRYQRAELPLKLDGLEAARGFFAGCFANAGPEVESLWVAHFARASANSASRRSRTESGVSML